MKRGEDVDMVGIATKFVGHAVMIRQDTGDVSTKGVVAIEVQTALMMLGTEDNVIQDLGVGCHCVGLLIHRRFIRPFQGRKN